MTKRIVSDSRGGPSYSKRRAFDTKPSSRLYEVLGGGLGFEPTPTSFKKWRAFKMKSMRRSPMSCIELRSRSGLQRVP